MTRAPLARPRIHPTLPAAVRRARRSVLGVGTALLLVATTGCATLQQLTALRQVDFALERVAGARVAGVDLFAIRGFDDLSLSDGLALANAVGSGELPLTVALDVRADNPESNVEARMLQLDWTLELDGRETVAGRVDREVVIPSGGSTPVPVTAELDLIDFFDGGARELFELAYGLTPEADEPTEVTLRLLPTIRTALGPIRYETPVRVSLNGSR